MNSASASHSSGDKSHGRRLTKNPPKAGMSPHFVSQGNSSTKNWASGSIQRTPSAPVLPRSTHGKSHHRTPTSPNPQTLSSSSSSLEQTRNPSPLLQQEGFRQLGDTSIQQFTTLGSSRPVSGRLSGESTSGGSSLESSDKQNTLRRAPPPPLSNSHTEMTTTTARPQLRQSSSFTMGEKSGFSPGPPKAYTSSGTMSPKRNSDEVRLLPSGKSKGGFSKFMNSMLGSPKRVEISHPTNPVHVTHVGFNFVTGEFTVRKPLASSFVLPLGWVGFGLTATFSYRDYPKNGNDYCTRAG